MNNIDHNGLNADDRAAIRELMANLQELSAEPVLDCIGLKSLLRHFGTLVAREVELGLVVQSRDQNLYPVILGAVAKWTEELSLEHYEREERPAAEALEGVKRAASSARNVIEALERERDMPVVLIPLPREAALRMARNSIPANARDASGRACPVSKGAHSADAGRECPAIRVKRNTDDAIDALTGLFILHGPPAFVCRDNCPAFAAVEGRTWTEVVGEKTAFTELRSSWRNGSEETLHARLRDQLRNGEIFCAPREARTTVEGWRQYGNTRRPPQRSARRPASAGHRPCDGSRHRDVPTADPEGPEQATKEQIRPLRRGRQKG